MKSRRLLVLLVAVGAVAGSVALTVTMALRVASGLTQIDAPAEVAGELARLQAMPVGCELEYGRQHVRRSRADVHETVWIRACGEQWMSERLTVPQVGEKLHFRLSRDNASEAWTVEVNTESGPRTELIQAIRAFTPHIVEGGPRVLAVAAAQSAKANADDEAQQRATAEDKAKNASSYK